MPITRLYIVHGTEDFESDTHIDVRTDEETAKEMIAEMRRLRNKWSQMIREIPDDQDLPEWPYLFPCCDDYDYYEVSLDTFTLTQLRRKKRKKKGN